MKASSGEPLRLRAFRLDGFIIRFAVLPAAKEDSDPLEGQGANGHLMRCPLRALLAVIAARPERSWYGLPGPFNERLPQKLVAEITLVHPCFLSTALGDWRDADVLGDCLGAGSDPTQVDGSPPSAGRPRRREKRCRPTSGAFAVCTYRGKTLSSTQPGSGRTHVDSSV